MLGSAVSSKRPTDLQPKSLMGEGDFPETKRQADAGVHMGWPYSAVGMHKALHSSKGLPRRSSSAPRILAFETPPEVRSSFMSVCMLCGA
jgi:hypothetical protein